MDQACGGVEEGETFAHLKDAFLDLAVILRSLTRIT